MSDTLTKLTYQLFQAGKSSFSLAHKTLSVQLRQLLHPSQGREAEALDTEMLNLIARRLEDLLEQDWEDAEAGVYPKAILFDNAWDDFFRYYPLIWLDTFAVWERVNNRNYQVFSPEIDLSGYPKYYLQNFHHQTDGYLSDTSANLYDLQVELLFGGAADPMRRRIISPLKSALKSNQPNRVLDVACGTGRTLKMLMDSIPDTSLYGLDLSVAYLRKAKAFLRHSIDMPQLIQGNGESLPFRDNYFDAIVSVFLFHELPPQARQNVINECCRVMKPGGMLVICDSVQASDSPEFQVTMKNFPLSFHEPYFRNYVSDDLNTRLTDAGFGKVETQIHFMSKYWITCKSEPRQ